MSNKVDIHGNNNSVTINTLEARKKHSVIQRLIMKMIELDEKGTASPFENTLPYSIEDKLKINNFTSRVAKEISDDHLKTNPAVEDGIKNLMELEPRVKRQIEGYYRRKYLDLLHDLKISRDDDENIKTISEKIFDTLNDRIYDEIYKENESDIDIEDAQNYIRALTIYAFYRCYFLIKVEIET